MKLLCQMRAKPVPAPCHPAQQPQKQGVIQDVPATNTCFRAMVGQAHPGAACHRAHQAQKKTSTGLVYQKHGHATRAGQKRLVVFHGTGHRHLAFRHRNYQPPHWVGTGKTKPVLPHPHQVCQDTHNRLCCKGRVFQQPA